MHRYNCVRLYFITFCVVAYILWILWKPQGRLDMSHGTTGLWKCTLQDQLREGGCRKDLNRCESQFEQADDLTSCDRVKWTLDLDGFALQGWCMVAGFPRLLLRLAMETSSLILFLRSACRAALPAPPLHAAKPNTGNKHTLKHTLDLTFFIEVSVLKITTSNNHMLITMTNKTNPKYNLSEI